MKKSGQFYLVAVIVIIAIFFAFITIQNFVRTTRSPPIIDIQKEVQIERGYTLDYIANNDLSDSEAIDVLENFSKSYTEAIGRTKDVIFIIGNPSSVEFIGNYANKTEISYGTSGEEYNITSSGDFKYTLTPSGNSVYVKLYNNEYDFKLNEGQNIYYIIHHQYGNEVYIIQG